MSRYCNDCFIFKYQELSDNMYWHCMQQQTRGQEELQAFCQLCLSTQGLRLLLKMKTSKQMAISNLLPDDLQKSLCTGTDQACITMAGLTTHY